MPLWNESMYRTSEHKYSYFIVFLSDIVVSVLKIHHIFYTANRESVCILAIFFKKIFLRNKHFLNLVKILFIDDATK